MASQALALAQPLKVGNITLPNRIVMGSMHTGMEGDADHFDELARFYGERARGGAALVVTGGFAPNYEGRMTAEPGYFDSEEQVAWHKKIPEQVHKHGGRVLLQILHAGRYGYHDAIVAPSPIKSPINRDTPRELTEEGIEQTIRDYAKTSQLAQKAGYDGVEIMGSEGYLITQFLATHTNARDDKWGGSLENRARFGIEVVKAVKAAVTGDFLIAFRISAQDLITTGLSDDEIIWFAKQLEAAGADLLSTGIGWHEAQVPTIAGVVPHAAFLAATTRLKNAVKIPVTASNRINLPETAERIVASGAADLVSMARPLLADPAFANKVIGGRPDQVNICIACNQACLDHYFTGKVITCVVNPRAAREGEFTEDKAPAKKRVAVVGAGVAGLAAALEAAKRGHEVIIFDAQDHIGGQLRLAARVPGKADYQRAIDGFQNQLSELGVVFRLGKAVGAKDLMAEKYDEIVCSTGILPRDLGIPGSDRPNVIGYQDILSGAKVAGSRVAIIGGGGIGHDVAIFLAQPADHDETSVEAFAHRWGVNGKPSPEKPARAITMLKRSEGGFGRTLGKSTGWIVRAELRDFGVQQLAGVKYVEVTDKGLVIEAGGQEKLIEVDTIVVCAGQETNRTLADELEAAGQKVHIIGGAKLAGELDAKRAIDEGAQIGNRM